MSDLREQLKKAGLVSEKDLRRAKHQERVHATEVGHKGIEAERAAETERYKAEVEARKQAERAQAEERRRREQQAAARGRLAAAIQSGWIREATFGSRRFFFEAAGGRISYLDLSDQAARRVAAGSAAIIATAGAVRGEHCVVTAPAAREVAQLQPDLIRAWNRAPRGSSEA